MAAVAEKNFLFGVGGECGQFPLDKLIRIADHLPIPASVREIEVDLAFATNPCNAVVNAGSVINEADLMKTVRRNLDYADQLTGPKRILHIPADDLHLIVFGPMNPDNEAPQTVSIVVRLFE